MIDVVGLLDRHAPWHPCAAVPALSAWHAGDEVALWEQLERAAGTAIGVPYFAIPWPSAQAVARALLDGRIEVRGRRVADVGCGSGLVACAASLAGAAEVLALDVDPLAVTAAAELARRHRAQVTARVLDPLEAPDAIAADLVLCADLVSRAAQAAPFARAIAAWRARGAGVFLADSGRPFFDPQGLPLAFTTEVPTSSPVDGAGTRVVRVYGDFALR
jgi:predicted nicotinamide N-methyase